MYICVQESNAKQNKAKQNNKTCTTAISTVSITSIRCQVHVLVDTFNVMSNIMVKAKQPLSTTIHNQPNLT